MIRYRRLAESDLSKLSEVDRSEVIRVGYGVVDGKLVSRDVVWDSPNWASEGDGEHSVAAEIEFCRSHLARSAIAIGCFEGEALVAIGILTPEIRPAMAQLAYLHVSRSYRRKGIGAEITHRLLAYADAMRFRHVYVSAVPSESAVGFYRSFGFELVEEPLPELFEIEPDDIHMILDLEEAEAVNPA